MSGVGLGSNCTISARRGGTCPGGFCIHLSDGCGLRAEPREQEHHKHQSKRGEQRKMKMGHLGLRETTQLCVPPEIQPAGFLGLALVGLLMFL